MGGNHQHQSSSTVKAIPPSSPNPIVELQARFKEMEVGFKTWFAKQPLPARVAMKAAVVVAIGSVKGAAIGGLAPINSDNRFIKYFPLFAGGPLIRARNVAVLLGTNDGISFAMESIHGVEDTKTSMASGFAAGVMFSLVSGMGGPNPAVHAVKSGVFYALVKGSLFKLLCTRMFTE